MALEVIVIVGAILAFALACGGQISVSRHCTPATTEWWAVSHYATARRAWAFAREEHRSAQRRYAELSLAGRLFLFGDPTIAYFRRMHALQRALQARLVWSYARGDR